jgi:hypothetical protein
MDKIWVVWRVGPDGESRIVNAVYSRRSGLDQLQHANTWFTEYKHKLVAYQKVEEVR